MDNFIIGLVIIIILFFASAYIYKSKKRGDKCIGCSYRAMGHGKNCKNKFDDN